MGDKGKINFPVMKKQPFPKHFYMKKKVCLVKPMLFLVEDDEFAAMETMTEILKIQQKTALELTRLVLEHCKDEKRTKETVLSIFKDASNLIMSQMAQ